ncbi:M20 family metallopeptidase [Neobacillus sp. SuZ13]|uniref:M20 family metallopeptidase n=1 Tax=Neobacillus sp. SuZ13 TaxID=3047875 RepID=UPI0024BFC4EC|nr:M20 family metallopeptidase [Neobacillus sp. SuZ13]WHY69749.1 M20 family metallopeptidase [Neobacillus sp. SuZ13]
MMKDWHFQLEEMYEQMVVWRRHMHENPELSFHEVDTPKMIAEILSDFGIEVRTSVGGRGVVGLIRGAKPGKTIALRADFDALPIQDEKEVPYKSKVPGVMHACGHDGHTATLLGVAKVLSENRHQLSGNVVLLHQHAEELAPGGAIAMIEDGCLDGVDVVFGTHLASGAPLGTYLVKSGYTMAAADAFKIKIQGKGGHGSSPHETIDAIAIGAQMINQLQYIVSRRVNPQHSAVVSVGSFHAGNASNVIADSAELTGTIRSFDKDVRVQIEEEFRTMVSGVCSAFHAEYEIEYNNGYPALYNHERETEVFKDIVKNTLDEGMLVDMTPIMGAEDFSYYLQEKPGMFFHTGARNEEIGASYPHHHPKFDFDEKAMIYAGKALLSIVHQYTVENVEQILEEPAY